MGKCNSKCGVMDMPADVIRLIAKTDPTLPITLRLTCRRFRNAIRADTKTAKQFIEHCEAAKMYSLVTWAISLGAQMTPQYTDTIAAGGDPERIHQMCPPKSENCVIIACAKGDPKMVRALIEAGNTCDLTQCMAIVDRNLDWSGTPFKSSGLYNLLINDGRADRMQLATHILSQRLAEMRRDGYPSDTSSRTHVLFTNGKAPFEAYGFDPEAGDF